VSNFCQTIRMNTIQLKLNWKHYLKVWKHKQMWIIILGFSIFNFFFS
jgi:hypothetical protein